MNHKAAGFAQSIPRGRNGQFCTSRSGMSKLILGKHHQNSHERGIPLKKLD